MKVYLIYFGFVLLMLGVVVKTAAIQMEGRKSIFSSKSGRIQTVEIPIIAKRGQIVDYKGNPLVTSVSFFEIRMDASVPSDEVFNEGIDSLSIELAALYPEKTAREYASMIRKARTDKNRFLLIHKKASNEERRKLEKMHVFREGRFEGGLIDNIETIVRTRPHGILLHRTLGYVRENIHIGLEAAYNEILSGTPGIELKEKMATGLKPTGTKLREAVDGSDIVTSIDIDIQEVAENELMRQLVEQDARYGCAIVMEVKTGRIRAIANLQRTAEDEYYEVFNYALGVKTYPGSTMKLASLMAALEDGYIDINDTVNASGAYKFYHSTLHDSHEAGYGRITIQRAFEVSSNVIAKVINKAYRENPQQYIDRIKSFGLGDKLGVEIDGEPIPTLYEPGSEKWSGLSLPWMSIGYEIQLTPLQILTFYNGVANNGTIMKPQFVTQIRKNGIIEKAFDPIVLRKNICSDNTIAILKRCMEGVVESGTGKNLQSASFKIAGKTGTSRLDKGGDPTDEGIKHQASFVGYFPADDPIYSCIVVIAAPTKSIYGSKVSGTVFTAIANKVYSTHLSYQDAINETGKMKNEMPTSIDGNAEALKKSFSFLGVKWNQPVSSTYANTHAQNKGVDLTQRNISKTSVPDLTGLNLRDAAFIMGNLGYYIQVSGAGRVISQSIPAGSELEKGRHIKLVLE